MAKEEGRVTITLSRAQYNLISDLLRRATSGNIGNLLTYCPLGPKSVTWHGGMSKVDMWAQERAYNRYQKAIMNLERCASPQPKAIQHVLNELMDIYAALADQDPWWEPPTETLLDPPNFRKHWGKRGAEPYPEVSLVLASTPSE